MASRLIGLILICVAAFVAVSLYLPETSQKKIKALFLSDSQKSLFAECEKARQELRKQELPTVFAKVEYLVRDKRFEEDPILQDLRKCFVVNEKSPVGLEAEVFSSDFGNWASDDLQVQLSVFDMKSNNKLAEIGFKLDHKNPSDHERVPDNIQANSAHGPEAGAKETGASKNPTGRPAGDQVSPPTQPTRK